MLKKIFKTVITIFIIIVLNVTMFYFIVKFNDKSKGEVFLQNENNNIVLDVKNESIEKLEKDESIEISRKIENLEVINKEIRSENVKATASGPIKVATRSKIDKINFVGDIYFAKNMRKSYDEGGYKNIVDVHYRNLLNDADLNVGNLECAISDDLTDEADKKFTFALPSKYARAFSELKIGLFTIANNHILDFGEKALISTMKELKNLDIPFIGAGRNITEAEKYYIKEIDGKIYAFFSVSQVLPKDSWKASKNHFGVANGYDVVPLAEKIEKLKKSVDKVIVYMHWGVETEKFSNDLQRKTAYRLVDAGADLIVGSHTHEIQEIEYYKNVPIVYGLGNFIYGGTSRDTLLLEAAFDYSKTRKGILQLRIYPGISSYERAKMYKEDGDEFPEKCKEMQNKCGTCFIAENGYVFTIEQVMRALGLATDSEIEKEEDVDEETNDKEK